MYSNVLKHERQRYLWVALALVLAAAGVYLTHAELPAPSGSTWQGYLLGSLGALLILLLISLGIRKRSYRATLGTVKGWVSAHVYLGVAALVTVTLHTGFQLGWNVHTLGYALLWIVVVTGIYGLNAYLRYPATLADTRAGNPRANLFAELHELNREGLKLAADCVPEVGEPVASSIRNTQLGGGLIAQLWGADRSTYVAATGTVANIDQQPIIDDVSHRVPRTNRTDETATLQSVITMLSRRQVLLRRIRMDIRYQGRMRLWLYLHVPCAVALVVAVLVHVLTVFLYW
jgi:hypothetical protein